MGNHEHPDDGDLLLYLDGELEITKAETTRHHLDSCWTCRMRASNIQNAILEYARERERWPIPEPPSSWRDLTGDFERVHAIQSPSLLKRIRMGVLFRNGRVAMFGAGAMALAAASWIALTHEPSRIVTAPTPAITAPPAAVTPPAPRVPHPDLPPVRMPDQPATVHEELAVVAELHRLRAYLGEPIDLGRSGSGRLVLNASGLAPDRQQEIRKALSSFPDLAMRFSGPSPAPAVPAEKPSNPVVRRPIAFESELLRYTGSRQALQQLANDALDASDQIAMYAHALAKLDQRFSDIALTTEDRDVLARIRDDHLTGARRALQSLDMLLNPVFQTMAVAPTPAPPADLLQAALAVDHLTNSAFAGAQSDLNDRDLYAELRGWIAKLGELLR